MTPFEYSYTDIAFCRIYFTRATRLYCLQEEIPGLWYFYVCYDDEPGHRLILPDSLPVPDDGDDFHKSARQFLISQERKVG